MVVFAGMVIMAKRAASQPQASEAPPRYVSRDPSHTATWSRESSDLFAKMQELKKLHDANLISEAEYEKKRKEILNNL